MSHADRASLYGGAGGSSRQVIESPRSAADRKKRLEWASEDAQDTLAGEVFAHVKTANLLEDQIIALKKQNAQMAADHQAELATTNAEWSRQFDAQSAANEAEKRQLVNNYEKRLEAEAAAAMAAERKLKATIASLNNDLIVQGQTLTETKEELSFVNAAIKNMADKMKEHKEIILGLQSDRDILRQEIVAKQELVVGLKAEISGLNGKLKRADLEYADLDMKYNQQNTKLSAALRQIAEQEKMMERIRAEAEAKYAKLMTEIERITGVKVSVEDLLSIEQTATNKLKSEIDKLLGAIDQLKRVAEENEARKRKIMELEAALLDSESENKSLRGECERIKSEAEEHYRKFTREIEDITGKKVVVEGDLSTERSVTQKLQDEMHRLQQMIDGLMQTAEENERNKARIQQLEEEIARLKGNYPKGDGDRLRAMSDELAKKDQEIADLKADFAAQMKALKASYEATIESLNAQIHFLRISQGHLQLKGMLMRWRNLQVGVAMSEWIQMVLYARSEKAFARMLAKMSEKDRQEALRRLNYLIHMWNGAFLPMAFLDWKNMTVIGKQGAGKAKFAAAKLEKMNMLHQYHAWNVNAAKLKEERSAAEIAALKKDLSYLEEELENSERSAANAARAALTQYGALQAQCAGLETAEQQALISKRTMERKLEELRRAYDSQAKESAHILALEKRKMPPLESEISRLESEVIVTRRSAQEQGAAYEAALRKQQRKVEASLKQAKMLEHALNSKDHRVGVLESEIPMWEGKIISLQKALQTANADERVSILSEQNDLLQQRMNAVKKEVAGSYEQSVLAKKQAEMFMLERDAMVSKMKTTLTEIDALRASWMSCVEETREVRSQNEALYAHNNRLEIEYTNISVQLEEAMQEAAKSQMKMMEILRDTTGLRNARDKAYSDLETSSMEKLALKTDLASMLDNLKDAYTEVDRRKGDMYRLSSTLSGTKAQLMITGAEKDKLEKELRDEISDRESSIVSLESQKQKVTEKLYRTTDSMVDAQQKWGEAESKLDGLKTELVEYEQMTGAMTDYVGDMFEYQENTVNDLDTIYGVSSTSEYLSSKGSAVSKGDRLMATRYIHGS